MSESKGSIDIFFGEIQRNAEVAARRKIGAEHRALKKEVTSLRKLKVNFNAIVKKEKTRLKIAQQNEIKQQVAKKVCTDKELYNRLRAVQQRETQCRSATARIKEEIKALDKIKKMSMNTFVLNNRSSSWRTNETIRTRAIDSIRKSKK